VTSGAPSVAPGAAPAPVVSAVTLKAPQLSFTDTGLSVTDGVTRNGLWSVTSDDLAWEYSLDQGRSWIKGVGGSFEVQGDGPKMIWVRARDDAGNTSEIVMVTCVLDTTPPAPVAVAPDSLDATRTLRITGLEPDARWEYSLDEQGPWLQGTGPALGVLGNALGRLWLGAHAARARGQLQGQPEADADVQQPGDRDAGHAPPEGRGMQHLPAQRAGGGRQLAGGQRDVPHLQRQPHEGSHDHRHHAQHHAQRDVGGQRRRCCSATSSTQRSARVAPSRATMRGFQAMALSRRWKTNQFSAQPATSELAKSSTPVKAANSAVGPEQRQRAARARPACAPTSGAPEQLPRQPLRGQHQRGAQREVAEDARRLRADQVHHVVDEGFHRGVALQIAQALRHRRRRHRRLLGGHRPVQQHDDTKLTA
jgi:hypothetical protein